MSIREVRIETLGELIQHVTPSEPDERTGRRRDTGVYRGASTPDSRLLTSLDRLGGATVPHVKGDLEEHILRNFIRYARPYILAEPQNDWEYLVTAQHHGVPTRLLDWSYSPLVAAFFATRPNRVGQEIERVVWRFDWQRAHRAFDLPSLALLSADLDRLAGGEHSVTPWLVMRGKIDHDFVCLLEPPSIDARIAAQAAVFTLCTDKTRSLEAFLDEHGLADALTRFVIPAKCVAMVRDQLDLAGIDERRLFPDLDGVAAAIRRYYA